MGISDGGNMTDKDGRGRIKRCFQSFLSSLAAPGLGEGRRHGMGEAEGR